MKVIYAVLVPVLFGLIVQAQVTAEERTRMGLPASLCYELILGPESNVSELESALTRDKINARLESVNSNVSSEGVTVQNPASAEIIRKYAAAIHLHVTVDTYEDLARSMEIQDRLAQQHQITLLGRKDFRKDCQ